MSSPELVVRCRLDLSAEEVVDAALQCLAQDPRLLTDVQMRIELPHLWLAPGSIDPLELGINVDPVYTGDPDGTIFRSDLRKMILEHPIMQAIDAGDDDAISCMWRVAESLEQLAFEVRQRVRARSKAR